MTKILTQDQKGITILKKMKNNKIDWLELVITLLPILFIFFISIWHAFGVKGKQPWMAIYFLSNHLFVIYLSFIVYYSCSFYILRNLLKYVVIPYFTFKIFYQLCIWFNLNIGTDLFWEYVWGIIAIVVFIIGSIILWKQLKKTG